MRREDVAAPVGDQRVELAHLALLGRIELLQSLVELLLIHQQTGSAQARDGAELVLAGLVGHPGQRRKCRIGLALVGLHLGRQQGALLRVQRTAELVLQVVERPRGPLDVARLGHAFEFLVERGGLAGFIALPPVPAVPRGKAAEHKRQGPGDQAAVLLPEGLEIVELFLLLQV